MKISKSKIQKIQAKKKLTQRDIAALLNFTPNYISLIINGKNNISPKTVGKIAEALEVDPDEILEEEGK